MGQNIEYVAGAGDLNLNEAATILGEVIGKSDLKWVQFPYDQAEEARVQMGLSPSLAEAYIEFCKALNNQSLTGTYQRTPENTSPTTLEEFAEQEFAKAWSAQFQQS